MTHRRFHLTRTRLGGVLLLVGALGFSFDRAAAQSLEDVVWAAVTLERTLESREVAGILALGALQRLARGGGDGGEAPHAGPPDPERLESASRWLTDALDRLEGQGGPRCTTGDAVDGMRCALESLLPGAPSELAQALAAEGRAFLALEGPMSWADPFQRYTENVLDQVVGLQMQWAGLQGDTGEFDPMLAMARLTGVDPSVGIPTLLARSTGLEGLASGLVTEGQDVMGAYAAYLNGLSRSAQGWLTEAQNLEGRVLGLRSQATDRAMVYLTGKTAAVTGLEAAVTERIRVLGNAALDLQAEGSAFLTNLRQMGQQAAVGVLSGNMLSVAQGVAAFLQGSPGAFGVQTAEDLREIRNLVATLEVTLQDGFDGVDQRFDEVFRALDGGFARMEHLVQQQHREVMVELGEIRSGFEALASRTDQFEATVRAYLEAGFDRDHARTLIRCLEHRERFAVPMTEPVFRECLTDFRARGAQDARDALLTDRTTPVDDFSLSRVLEDRSLQGLARGLPLLARAAEQRFGYAALGGGRGGANPVEWAVAAQAYASMLEAWPDLAAQVGAADLEALLAVGVEVQGILRALIVEPATGEVGALSSRILGTYADGLEAAVAESDLLARRYQQAQLRRVDPALLLHQALPAGGTGPALQLPPHVAAGIPTELRTATVLALEAPVLLYRTSAVDHTELDNLRRRWTFFGRDHDRRTYTQTTLTVELRTSDGTLVTSWAVTAPPVLRMTEVMAGGFGSERVRSTQVHLADARDHFLQTLFPILAQAEEDWRRSSVSASVLRMLEQSIEAELRRFESASLNRVFGAVCEAGSASGPLGVEDQASVLRLRRALDQMTTARLVLAAVTGLALPPETRSAEPLASLLDHADGLLDRGSLCRIVASGESPLRVVWLEEVPLRRLQELTASLDASWRELLWIDPAGVRTPVPSTRVDDTVEMLRKAIRLQEVRRLTAAVP